VETETDIEKESHRSKEKDDIYLTPGHFFKGILTCLEIEN